MKTPGNRMSADIPSKLFAEIENSRQLVRKEVLSLVFSTGKSELFVRDLLAAQIDSSQAFGENSYVAREWSAHDLTIFDGELPIAIIEGKAWIHADVVNKRKLVSGDKSILFVMNRDLEKIRITKERFPKIRSFLTTLLVTCDSSGREFGGINPITYRQKHQSAIRSSGQFDSLISASNRVFKEFVQEHWSGVEINSFVYLHERYRDLTVHADLVCMSFPD